MSFFAAFIPLAGLVLMALFLLIGYYNRLVQLTNQMKNGWSQIDVQLKRRHDLIPNLVETVKGYMKHEREVLEMVTKARSVAMSAEGVGAQAQAETQLSRALGQLRVTLENYPELKASQNALALQEELASTENKIAFARQFYNDSVMHLNTKIESFPSNMVASLFHFRNADFFNMEDAARGPVKVSLDS